MTTEYFVIAIAQEDSTNSELYLLSSSSPEEAHASCVEDYKNSRFLDKNVNLKTYTAWRGEDKLQASLFMAKIVDKMQKDQSK